jgi:hypothetical protein
VNVKELVDELRKNLLRDISDEVGPRTDDQLWDNVSLVRYINDGQNQFATKTLCFRDETTPALTRLTLVEGQAQYDLDPRVRVVLSARVAGERVLSRTTYGGLYSAAGDVTLAYSIPDDHPNAAPRQFYTDRETGKLGVFPSPDAEWAGKTLVLRVARLPLRPLTYNNLDQVPEVREEYHLDILEWAAWRALRNHDVDGENMAKASAHKKRFDDAVKELSREAKRLLMQDFQFDQRSTTSWGC